MDLLLFAAFVVVPVVAVAVIFVSDWLVARDWRKHHPDLWREVYGDEGPIRATLKRKQP